MNFCSQLISIFWQKTQIIGLQTTCLLPPPQISLNNQITPEEERNLFYVDEKVLDGASEDLLQK
jgi:hypothetical protein